MFSGAVVADPTKTLHGCLDRLHTLDPCSLSGDQQGRLLVELTRAESRIAGLKLRLLAAAEKSETALRAGAASTGQWAASLAHTDSRDSQREVDLARRLERRSATRRALAEGRITPDHARVIVDTDRQLPGALTRDQRTLVEAALLDKAQTMSPAMLRRRARRAIEAVEPDPSLVDAHEDAALRDEETSARAKTRLTLHDNHDGTVTGHFTIPALQGHLLRKVLETITAPRRAHRGSSHAQSGSRTAPDTDWAHARGTAFAELLGHLPTDHLHPHIAATVVVTIDEEALRGRAAAAGLDTGDKVSAGEARRIACNAGIIPAVLGGRSRPLDLGRQRRLFTQAQRTALGLTHDTCAADGCERPFAWSELHHRKPWSHGGATDLADAVPLCHFHHQRIHDPDYQHRQLTDRTITFIRTKA